MELLVVRHAIAEDRLRWAATGRDDDERPLTERGIGRMRRGALGLRELVPKLDALATSPLTRAAQTAELLAEAYGGPEPTELGALAPGGSPRALIAWLHTLRGAGCVAVVGHEPDLGDLVAWLTTGAGRSFLEFKKGAACLLAFPDEPARGAALLRWSVAPRTLRSLATVANRANRDVP